MAVFPIFVFSILWFISFVSKDHYGLPNTKTPTDPNWARVVGYGPLSLCVVHKEGLCPSNGDINRLMMMRKTQRRLCIKFCNKT
jgi:hypothetical protein